MLIKSARSVYDISHAEQTVMSQRRATDHLLTSLLNAGTQAETATLQYADNRELKRYLQANAETDSALLRVKRLCTDTTQRLRLDTLQALINYRCSSTLDLIDALRKENKQGSSLQQQIKALKHSDKPVQMQVEVPVVERGEQIVIERRKKAFSVVWAMPSAVPRTTRCTRPLRRTNTCATTPHAQTSIWATPWPAYSAPCTTTWPTSRPRSSTASTKV